MKSQTDLLWGLLFIVLFALFFFLHRRLSKEKVLEQLKAKYKKERDEKKTREAAFISEYGEIENTSLFYKLDRLVLTSGIRKIIPFMNGEVFLLILAASVAAGFFIGSIFSGNIFVSLFVAAAFGVIDYCTLIALSGRTYNRIEDDTAIFVSLLSNHAKGSSDLVTIMAGTLPSLSGPLYSIVSEFLVNAEKTGNIDVSLDFMKESIDNRGLRTIIMNLKNCMHYMANYEEVLSQMTGQIASNLTAREERKNILFSMKISLVGISIMSLLIVLFIGKGIGVDVKEILTANAFGQGILFITGLLYLFVTVKLFGTDR